MRCRPAGRRMVAPVATSARPQPQPPRIGAGERKPYLAQHVNITDLGPMVRGHAAAIGAVYGHNSALGALF